jgi:DNA-directed RNA polymerase subunit RPC12/RpoP
MEKTNKRCKTCGKELPSTYRWNRCDACRESRADKLRQWGMGALTLTAAALALLNKGKFRSDQKH